MVALDDGRIAFSAFDHIRIDRALGEHIHMTDLLSFFFKHADELFPDDLPFLFRFCHTGQFCQEPLFCIHADQVHAELMPECLFHNIALVLPKKSVVYKYTGQCRPDGFA